MKKYLLSFLITSLLASTAVLAQATKSAAGHWEGSIETPSGPVAIAVDLAQGEKGKWVGEISIPSQNLSGYPLSNLKTEGVNVSFEMRGAPGVPAFNGKLSEDGKSISGNMAHGKATMTFKLERKGDAKLIESAPAAGGASKAGPAPNIAGSWEGTLDAAGNVFRIILKISKDSDGSLTATLDSPDQNNFDLPIPSFTAADKTVHLEMKYLGASFEGRLNKELTELSGTWYQTGMSFPLLLKRK
jgi:hypothetical protein